MEGLEKVQENGIGVENPPPKPHSPGCVAQRGQGRRRRGVGEGGKAEQTERAGIKRIKVAAGGGGEGAGGKIMSKISVKAVSSPAVLPGKRAG